MAQPGTVLRLNRAASQPEVLVWVGNTFRIGRAADAHLVTRFLPRNKTNDLQTKRLSITHATIRCEGSELLLSDGSGLKPSSNGSAFDGKKLSSEHPVRLLKPGELKLANAYAIRVIPLLADSNEAPAIANLGDWSGRKSDTNAPLTGALLFIPNEKSDVLATLWLFSTAAFGDSSVSPIDFTSSPKIAALRYLRGCFWIEQQSTQSLLVNELPLARGEIAPLVTGQTLEVKGSRYAVEIQDPGKQQKA